MNETITPAELAEIRQSLRDGLKKPESKPEVDELFTTTELTSFGNYLLSRERAIAALANEVEENALFSVYSDDIPNWKAKHGEAGVAISEGPSPQPEKPRTVVLVDTPLVL